MQNTSVNVDDHIQNLLELILKTLDINKAEHIETIDLKDKTEIADYMIVASGTSKRHVVALSDYLHEALKKENIKDLQIEGADEGDWILLDVGDIIVHLFRPEVREFYKIEDMWKEIPNRLSRRVSDL